MKPKIFRRNKYIFFWSLSVAFAVLLLILFFAIPSLDSVYANGRVTDWQIVESDRFQVSLGTIPADPRIGVLHLSVRVKELAFAEFLTDASVSVLARGPKGSSQVEKTVLKNDSVDPTYFDGLINLDKEGLWNIVAIIDINEYSESVVFQVDVVKTHPLTGAVTLVAVMGFLVVLGFSARKFFIEQRRSKKINESN